MQNSHEFLRLVIDSITDHIVVIDKTGEIQFVNKSWSTFGSTNASPIKDNWSGVNYIEVCDKASAMGDVFGTQASTGIRSVIENREPIFYFEYPCHSPDEKRWFMMRVNPFTLVDKHYYVISHQDITERKLAEEKVDSLAKIDGLTDIPNRRAFDEFFHEEWRRCSRLKKTLCLAIVDLDHFKLLNDHHGHQSGDECLIKVGTLLKEFANRPNDICARYGGEEFVLVWGDTSLEQAEQLSKKLLDKISTLNIPNQNSPTSNYLTASIGLVGMIPTQENEEGEFIGKADSMLYKAKENGRNKVNIF